MESAPGVRQMINLTICNLLSLLGRHLCPSGWTPSRQTEVSVQDESVFGRILVSIRTESVWTDKSIRQRRIQEMAGYDYHLTECGDGISLFKKTYTLGDLFASVSGQTDNVSVTPGSVFGRIHVSVWTDIIFLLIINRPN